MVPFTPSAELPFIGNTQPANLGTTGWSYDNPFDFGSSFGVSQSPAAPVMSVPWGGSVSSMDSNILLDQMTSVPLSSAFGRNTTTKDMRTNYTIPYARAQNTDQPGFDFWKGYHEGLPVFLFTGRPVASPFGVFDPEANYYLTDGRYGGFNLGDEYESYFRDKPYAGFASNYTLPQVNFLLAASELSRTNYRGSIGEGCYRKEDVMQMYTFDGIIYNQEGGENPATGDDFDPGKGIIYNIVREGAHRNTRNVWSNEIGVQDHLYVICKRADVPHGGYRLNPNDTTKVKPQIPKRLLEALPKETRESYLGARCSRPWQFVPWSNPYKHAPTEEDLVSENEFGIEERGFAFYVGLNRYEPPVINREVMKMSKNDAHAAVNCEALEIYLDQSKMTVL